MTGVASDGAPNAVLSVGRDFLLEMAILARRELDPVDNLILLGVSQANVRMVGARDDSQFRFAFVDTNPGDELRRAIPIAALSRTLGLPFETARRRSMRLLK